MARCTRCSDAGYVYHVLNRAVGRATLFEDSSDYTAFEKVLRQAWERTGMRLVSYIAMPNHWHLVAWPERDGQLSEWAQWLTVTHVRRWHAHHQTGGTGPIYQGRFKSFPVQKNDHYSTVCRYVERNALRANLAASAEEWRWSSLWHRHHATEVPWLAAGPLPFAVDWLDRVNAPQTQAELTALRRSVTRGAPFGDTVWQQRTAASRGLLSALRERGRPKKAGEI